MKTRSLLYFILLPFAMLMDNFMQFVTWYVTDEGAEGDGDKKTVLDLKSMEAALDKMGTDIDKKLDDLLGKYVNKEDDAYKNMTKDLNDHMKKYVELQKQADQLDADLKVVKLIGAQGQKGETFAAQLNKALKDNAAYKDYMEASEKGRREVSVLLKVGTVTESGNFAGTEPIPPQVMPGVAYAPDRPLHVRDLLNIYPTNAPAVAFMRESAYTDGMATTAENAAYTQSDFTLTKATAEVYKIGTYMKIANEVLEDVDYITAYLAARLPAKLKNKEDNKLLYGTGSSDIEGFTVAATAFAAGTTSVAGANNWDVLRKSLQLCRAAEYVASAILINPIDALTMDLTKDSNGNYIFPVHLIENGNQKVKSVPIIESNAVTADDFLVGDFVQAAHLAQRRDIEIKFWQQDSDDVQKDLTTVTISERIALPITQAAAFRYGNFTDAKAAMEAAES